MVRIRDLRDRLAVLEFQYTELQEKIDAIMGEKLDIEMEIADVTDELNELSDEPEGNLRVKTLPVWGSNRVAKVVLPGLHLKGAAC